MVTNINTEEKKKTLKQALVLTNASMASISEIPIVDFDAFFNWHREELTNGSRVCALFAVPQNGEDEKNFILYSLLARDKDATLVIKGTVVKDKYPSLTSSIPAMHLFEREIYEKYNIIPQGHPWLKPVRFENKDAEVGVMDFFTIDGDEVHEVAVGPIHAGIIESGHFRFQCQGEVVMHLEISLGYHHRGIEEALVGKYENKKIAFIETIAGDTTIGHSWAYCSVIESLSEIEVSPRAQLIRAICLELERLANHTGDLGALSGDTGFLPTASFCGRLRGDYLNLTASICGNRFGRNLLIPGGVKYNILEENISEMLKKISATAKDTFGAISLLWKTDSVTARMMGRGILKPQSALEFSMVGPGARASGLMRDARNSHPLPHMTKHDLALKTYKTSDIFARAIVREKEIKESVEFIKRILKQLPEGELLVNFKEPENEFVNEVNTEFMNEFSDKFYNDVNTKFDNINIDLKTKIVEKNSSSTTESLQETIKFGSIAISKEIMGSVKSIKDFIFKAKDETSKTLSELDLKSQILTSEDLKPLKEENIKTEKKTFLKANSISVALVEAWRGEVCHIAFTDKNGDISTYKVVDPSFHNWIGLALAMRLQQISDFPLCNKSFNLSYCGHDL